MFFRSDPQDVSPAPFRLFASGRLARMVVAVIAVGVASAALAASPTMAEPAPLESDTDTSLCTPRGDDIKPEFEQADLEAAFKQALNCMISNDDPKKDDAAVAQQKQPLVVHCQWGGSTEYIGACTGHQGPHYGTCTFHPLPRCHYWYDANGYTYNRQAVATEADPSEHEAEAIDTP